MGQSGTESRGTIQLWDRGEQRAEGLYSYGNREEQRAVGTERNTEQ